MNCIKGCVVILKYYCEHCCTIHLNKDECGCCGNGELVPIVFDVQSQTEKQKNA